MRRGLPQRKSMRHDAHFVEELVRRSGNTIGIILPLSIIDPNPEQPRRQLGDLDDLTASIAEKGVLEPILVRSSDDGRYMIISGERRYRAAEAAGLQEIPAIELDADDSEVLEIALIENIQRKDLTPFEEAEGFQVLQEKFGYTHERLAQVLGKSRTTITESLQLNQIPNRIRQMCLEAGITSKSVLIQIARADDETAMASLVEQWAEGGLTRAGVREQTSGKAAKKAQRGRPKNFRYSFRDKELPFRLEMNFRKSRVERDEIIDALKMVIDRLKRE